MTELVLIAHNIRSSHNVGSLLRTADGLGVQKIYLTGYTPYPHNAFDDRLPHQAQKIHDQIKKTALGAELSVDWSHLEAVEPLIERLQASNYVVAALEQAAQSTSLPNYQPPRRVAILIGREVEGVEPEVLAACDQIIEIPMLGQKESFNVVQAAAMALYHCQYVSS